MTAATGASAATLTEARPQIEIPEVRPAYSGKVRDLYDLGDRLLIVATDRISAYDSILPTGIPGKGWILTQLSAFWFKTLAGISKHHLLSTSGKDFPPPFRQHAELLDGRSMLVKKTRRIDFECVVRGYLAGSAWREYRESGRVSGIKLPAGLRQSERLPEPIFTPATKANVGHDENVPLAAVESALGAGLARELERRSLALYQAAAAHAADRGLLLADTKFEFGLLGEELLLIDEALTPDSSRFWDRAAYVPGQPQEAFDKQYVRDFLDGIGWDHRPPAPPLTPEVVEGTRRRYLEAFERLTGHPRHDAPPGGATLPQGR
jgi:phosphoribosylaminoimidazole-succinocarboxamide synthase